jgi:hypothetical protein
MATSTKKPAARTTRPARQGNAGPATKSVPAPVTPAKAVPAPVAETAPAPTPELPAAKEVVTGLLKAQRALKVALELGWTGDIERGITSRDAVLTITRNVEGGVETIVYRWEDNKLTLGDRLPKYTFTTPKDAKSLIVHNLGEGKRIMGVPAGEASYEAATAARHDSVRSGTNRKKVTATEPAAEGEKVSA